jgi:DNA-3-methyladenine glycosylase II
MFNANSKVAKKIPLTSDDELVEALTAIPGVGLWTVNVLLVCNFGRLDVAPAPDAAIHRITQIIYGLGTCPRPIL